MRWSGSCTTCSERCRDPRSRLQSCRFDVYENVSDARVAFLNRALYSMRDLVAIVYGNFSMHSNVKIDVKIQTHLASPTFFHLNNPRNRAGDGADGPDDFFTRRRVHDFTKCRPCEANAVCRDECTCNECRPISAGFAGSLNDAQPFPAPANVLFDVEQQRSNMSALAKFFLVNPSCLASLIQFERLSRTCLWRSYAICIERPPLSSSSVPLLDDHSTVTATGAEGMPFATTTSWLGPPSWFAGTSK